MIINGGVRCITAPGSREHKDFFVNATFGSRLYYPHGERYSLSGDHKVYPTFWKAFTTSYVNPDLGSWPVPLTRTVVDDCGERETS
jgi:hypothetical protein